MTEENKTFQELDEQAGKAMGKRSETLHAIGELTDTYERGIAAKQQQRRETDRKIKQHSDGKVATFHQLKKVVQNIEVYEKNKNKIYRKLTALNCRKKGLVEIYKVLIHGGMPKREALEEPMFESYLNIYDKVFAPILSHNDDDVASMFSKKDEYMNGINLLFSRLQEDVQDIDEEIARLMGLESDIDAKLNSSKSLQEKLQKNYSIYTECIKTGKMELGAIIKDERELLADFERLLSDIEDLTKQEEHVAARLEESVMGVSHSRTSEKIEEVDEVVEENIEKDAQDIENVAMQVQNEKKTVSRKSKKVKTEESILAPAIDTEEPVKKNGRGKRDSILSSVDDGDEDIEALLKRDSSLMMKHDEHLLLDLSETLQ